MIRLVFHSEGARITGFTCEGHSGLEESGKDVLCAAVSAAVTLVEATINDVLGTGASVKVDDDVPRVELSLPPSSGEEQEDASQAILTGLMLLCVRLHDEYPDNIEVTAP